MWLTTAIALDEQGIAASTVQAATPFRRRGSPVKLAPPFRELHLRYLVDDLGEALGEEFGHHPMMPEFRV